MDLKIIGSVALGLALIGSFAVVDDPFSALDFQDTNCEWVQFQTETGSTFSSLEELEGEMSSEAYAEIQNHPDIELRENQGTVEFRSCISYE